MSGAQPTILRSRVGQRVLMLFAVCALVPLVVLAALSVSQVRNLLLEQNKARLSGIAKNFSVAVFERMLTVRDSALLLAAQPASTRAIPDFVAGQFLFLSRVDANGRLEPLMGTPPSEAAMLVEEYRASIKPPSTLLKSLPGERIFLLHQATGLAGQLVIGELNPAYVWSDTDELRTNMVVCVVDSTNMQYVRCPAGRELKLIELLPHGGAGADPSDLSWSKDGVAYAGRVWAQFMANEFGAKDWYFAVSIPEDDILAPIREFRRNFLLVVALAILLMVWFAGRQILAMLRPLGNLTLGTRLIAENDFKLRVSVDSRDEFGELGEAFNAMSARLGRQFHVSKAHAEIDQMILARETIERIVEAMLNSCSTLLPVLQIRAVVLDSVDADRGRRFSLVAGNNPARDVLETTRVTVPTGARPDLSSHTLVPYHLPDVIPAWAKASGVAYADAQCVLPLIWGRTVCGWLWVKGAAPDTLDEDDRRTLENLSGRLALAIAETWRDEALYQQAHFDPLTGLPNRLLFNDRLQLQLARASRESPNSAVLFVDLDNFKSVNDSQGHVAGDSLLCEAASRILATIRDSDTLSRHGGDEFTVLLADMREQRHAFRVGNAIIAALSRPFSVGGQDCFLSASVGIALFPDNGRTPTELLKNADTAMYRAKAAGKGQVMFFEEKMNADTVARLTVDRELRHALERGEFELHYQPQVSLKDSRLHAAEALIRWNHPERGLLSPGEFIPIAEDSGLISAIGRWVLEEACRQIVVWRHSGMVLNRISVNVSARQFRDPDFIDHIRRRVVAPGLAASIEFEITESVLLERTELLAEQLQVISGAGCTIALDDFGTGFSSLAYLKSLPVDVVKIDQAFIVDLDKSAESLAFVDAIIAMAHALGKIVVAEGVESGDQLRLLRERGCDMVQGYFLSRPLRAEEFVEFVSGQEFAAGE